MKSALVLSLLFVAAACGSAGKDTAVSASVGTSERILVPVEGTLGNITVKSAEAPASGIWTEIEVNFIVPCTARFETAAVNYDFGKEGKVRIFSSAFLSVVNRKLDVSGDVMVCQAFSTETKTVSIAGIVGADSIELVNLIADRVEIPNDTIQTISATDVKIVATRSLCPEGMVCVQGGTVLTLEVALSSCVNSIAQVAYHLDQKQLAVHAVEFVDRRAPIVDCAMTKVQHEIVLPMVFATEGQIALTVLQ